jgi:hypothetical protein
MNDKHVELSQTHAVTPGENVEPKTERSAPEPRPFSSSADAPLDGEAQVPPPIARPAAGNGEDDDLEQAEHTAEDNLGGATD